MSKHTKAGRKASFLRHVDPPKVKMLWRMSPAGWMVPYIEGTPDPMFAAAWPSASCPTAEQPHVVDIALPMVTIDRSRPQPAWVVLRNKP